MLSFLDLCMKSIWVDREMADQSELKKFGWNEVENGIEGQEFNESIIVWDGICWFNEANKQQPLCLFILSGWAPIWCS